MSYKDAKLDLAEFKRALTDEEKSRPRCSIWHGGCRWVTVDTSGIHHHRQCRVCCDRDASKIARLHGPANWDWLNGLEWDHLRHGIASTPPVLR